MAIIDTHKVFENLTDAGFNKTQAEALLDAVGESHDTLATKADLQDLAQATKADLQTEIAAVRAEIQALTQETKAEFADVRAEIQTLAHAVSECATKAELREVELRVRLHLGATMVIVAGLQITILGFLMALFTGVLP
ncbi:MAG: hypothetical protein OXM03_06565 [Chloroflexota bacterium]|nr:hypothetical protein [Chloroflexota bacterium]MDE2840275.1 hypothetical protein [Chloroflexota bacterium]MDE2930363.1 hypothetical protein [Chloroflexota bacterium]